MRLVALLLLSSLAAAQSEKAAWTTEDDRIAGVVSKEGKPVKPAKVHLASSGGEYNAVTDGEGRFLIWPVQLFSWVSTFGPPIGVRNLLLALSPRN
jgi:hypothetical protein